MENEYLKICPHCGKTYELTYIEQVPGCRVRDEEICPYCGAVNDSSMEVEFITRKVG